MIPIPQIRFNVLMDAQEEYDCSMGGNSTVDWSTWGAPQPYFGMFSLLFGFVTVPCYLFCTRIIWTMRRLTCYNLMFLLAVSDICSLIAGTLICGILLIKYYSIFHIVNNTLLPTCSVVLYLIMLLYI
ncbi:hypothetical protein PFISCL1PPCAC_13856, partial [Pristionchus fissidentatus]